MPSSFLARETRLVGLTCALSSIAPIELLDARRRADAFAVAGLAPTWDEEREALQRIVIFWERVAPRVPDMEHAA